jgi:hypothetical protein
VLSAEAYLPGSSLDPQKSRKIVTPSVTFHHSRNGCSGRRFLTLFSPTDTI